jgi:hypothetical protein
MVDWSANRGEPKKERGRRRREGGVGGGGGGPGQEEDERWPARGGGATETGARARARGEPKRPALSAASDSSTHSRLHVASMCFLPSRQPVTLQPLYPVASCLCACFLARPCRLPALRRTQPPHVDRPPLIGPEWGPRAPPPLRSPAGIRARRRDRAAGRRPPTATSARAGIHSSHKEDVMMGGSRRAVKGSSKRKGAMARSATKVAGAPEWSRPGTWV